MSYRKRGTSVQLEKAENRLAGIKQFETQVNYGDDLTEVTLKNAITKVDTLTKENNDLLTKADGVVANLKLAEKALSKLSSRFLKSVESRYGKDSVEYEKAGGTRPSDFKKRVNKRVKKSA
jgi:hypothetical protein